MKKYGYIDKSGSFVIRPIFEDAKVFSEGLAWASKEGAYGIIDKTGRFIIEPQFKESYSHFSEGLVSARRGYYSGYIDKTGRFVIEPKFEIAKNFHDGLALVMIGGKYGYINKSGILVVPPQFDEAFDFQEGRARVVFDKKFFMSLEGTPKCGFIDTSGKLVIPPDYKYAPGGIGFSDGLSQVIVGSTGRLNNNDKYGYIDKNGHFAIEAKFRFAHPFSDGLAEVRLDNKRGFIDKSGQFVFTLNDSIGFVGSFCEGLAIAERGDKFGYINNAGQFVIEPRFECASNFKEGLALVQSENKSGYIDKTGQYVVEPQFDMAGDFRDGLAPVLTEEVAHTSVSPRSALSKPEPTQHSDSSTTTTKASYDTSSTKKGCYVATSIYGSYDCPEVWTLRRFRDIVLEKSWCGRLFISAYYFISPYLVNRYGHSSWFKRLLRRRLDRIVASLISRGFENTPYVD